MGKGPGKVFKRAWKYALNCALYGLVCATVFIVRRMSLSSARACAGAGTKLLVRLPLKSVKTARRNIRDAFGVEREDIVSALFCNLFTSAVEFIHMDSFSKDVLHTMIEPAGVERLDEVMARGKGCIIVTPHFGNWELIPPYIMSMGYGGKVVARRLRFEMYNKTIIKQRRKCGMDVIFADSSVKVLIAELKKNRMIGLLPDQTIKRFKGMYIPFFHQEAYTLTSPAVLSMLSGAPIVPCFMVRKKAGESEFLFVVEKPIVPDNSAGLNKQDTIRDITVRWSGLFENYIRENPEQWVWFHERWRRV